MIYPTASEILRQIDQTLLAISDINMPRMDVKSALATTRHLVRHVELRLRLERSILLDDIEKAGGLLAKIATYLDSLGADHAARAKDIRATLAVAPSLLSSKEDELDHIINRAKALRELIYVNLAALQNLGADITAIKAYADLRQLIREYISYQIKQEARVIDPAFIGQGPRR